MVKTNFSEHNKILGSTKRFGSNCPEYPTESAGLGRIVARKSSIGAFSPSCLCRGARHSEHLFL